MPKNEVPINTKAINPHMMDGLLDLMGLDETVKVTIKDAAQKLTSYRKRAFMAKVAEDYFEGSARKAERYLGWNRNAVQLGLHERRTGLTCVDNYHARGRHATIDASVASDCAG